mgnify:CR=1 FL=1
MFPLKSQFDDLHGRVGRIASPAAAELSGVKVNGRPARSAGPPSVAARFPALPEDAGDGRGDERHGRQSGRARVVRQRNEFESGDFPLLADALSAVSGDAIEVRGGVGVSPAASLARFLAGR